MKKLLLVLSAALFLFQLSAQEVKNDPLVILNGVQTGLKVADIDPNTIESVNVLKGEAAIAIYGQIAKDGVIQIRTKESIRTGLHIQPDTDPLVIVDDVEFTGKVNSLDPNSIAVVSVIKNSPQVEKYGERGRNGVILITTKKGAGQVR